MLKALKICQVVAISMLMVLMGSVMAVESPTDKPNIIVIMADDLGYGDLSCYGATSFATPHIDRLARDGMRFTNAYCSASTCTPTRYSFLTGAYAFRNKGTGIAAPNSKLVVPPDRLTIADILKKSGYRTAVIGKWHLGLGGADGPNWNGELAPGPQDLGFDYHFLLPTTNDRVPQVYIENRRVLNLDANDPLWIGDKKPSEDHPTGITHRSTLKLNWSHGHNGTIHNGISRIGFYTGGHSARFRDEDLADKWVEKSVEWIRGNRENPFFLFFASHDLHVPRMPHERFQGATKLGFRGDSIIQLDWCVGELRKTIEQLGIGHQTMIVFCSDNGPVMDDGYQEMAIEKRGDHRASGPFRGGKYSVHEGGTRTPFITCWEGIIPQGESKEMVCTIDFASSFAGLVGQPLSSDDFPDSFNVIDALMGKSNAKGRDSLVQQDNGLAGNFGFRRGKWKLHRNDAGKTRNVNVAVTLADTTVPTFQLFDLEQDPGETDNIIQIQTEVAQNLKLQLQNIIDQGRSRP